MRSYACARAGTALWIESEGGNGKIGNGKSGTCENILRAALEVNIRKHHNEP